MPEFREYYPKVLNNLCPIDSLKTSAGLYTRMGSGTMEELLKIHFPGSTIISEPMESWAALALELVKNANHFVKNANNWSTVRR